MGFLNDIPLISDFILPAVDIGLLAFILYKLYEVLEETRAVQLIRGAVIMALAYAIAWMFQLSTLLWLLASL